MQESANYTQLQVWQVAMDFCVAVYKASRSFPRDEVFGLTRQLRDAATSIAANIAEGSARRTRGDFAYFISIAMGSLRESETLIHVAHRVGYLPESAELLSTSSRIGQMLTKLRQSLQRSTAKSR